MDNFIHAAAVLGILNSQDDVDDANNLNDEVFSLSNQQFRRLFRLSKDVVIQLIDLLEPYIIQGNHPRAFPVQSKILSTLRFLASGSYQLDIAESRRFEMSQSSVSRFLHQVLNVMNYPEIMMKWVKLPTTKYDLLNLRNKFIDRFGIPAIGCIDCSHVAIIAPPVDNDRYPEHVYVNRKGFHSINVQIISDASLNILNVNAKFPGSVHDSYIWRMSRARQAMEKIYQKWPQEFFHLLGDSGYPLQPWLLTPFDNTADNTAESLYNLIFRRARCSVERAIGLLKMVQRSTLHHRVLHYTPTMSSKIVNACVLLHNMRLQNGEDYAINGEDEEPMELYYGYMNNLRQAGQNVRNNIVQEYCT